MNRNSIDIFREKITLIGVVAEFVLTEILMVVVFRTHGGTASPVGSFEIYATLFVAMVPATAGLAGYFFVKKKLSAPRNIEIAAPRISWLFLGTVGGAYTALILVIGLLVKLGR